MNVKLAALSTLLSPEAITTFPVVPVIPVEVDPGSSAVEAILVIFVPSSVVPLFNAQAA